MGRPSLWGFGVKVIVVQRESLMNRKKKLVTANNGGKNDRELKKSSLKCHVTFTQPSTHSIILLLYIPTRFYFRDTIKFFLKITRHNHGLG